MKSWIVSILALVCILGLVGCNNRTMDYIIENEPSIIGIVEKCMITLLPSISIQKIIQMRKIVKFH